MSNRRVRVYRKPAAGKRDRKKSVDDIVRELTQNSSRATDYRERSLEIHGLICAKCAREFDYKDRHLLTVHHKDGNHTNNPPDGSIGKICVSTVMRMNTAGDCLVIISAMKNRGPSYPIVFSLSAT